MYGSSSSSVVRRFFGRFFFIQKFASGSLQKARRQLGGIHPGLLPRLVREKNSFLRGSAASSTSSRNRECDHVGLLCCDRREAHALRLSNAVLAPQVAVGFHCQCAAVLMA